jgi:MoxR-like ATPase
MDLESAIRKSEKEWDSNPVKAQEEKEVIQKYGTMFHPNNIDKLTAEDYRSFLNIKNNKHWNGLERRGPEITRDMNKFRNCLKILLDESKPIGERIKQIRDRNSRDFQIGFGPAYYTPVLLVVYPEKYPVINKVVKNALEKLNLYTDYDSKEEWESYLEVKEKIIELAKKTGFSLWKMDWLWWNLVQREDYDKPIALCWSVDDSNKIGEFVKIISKKNKAYWGINWSAEKLREDDYPLTGYINHKKNIIAKGTINRIISNQEFQKFSNKSDYAIPQGKNDSDYKNYIEFDSLESLENPFPTKNLRLYFEKNKPVQENLQNKVYVIDSVTFIPNDPDSNYWKISPGENAEFWEEFRDAGIIGIGWNEMGDLSKIPPDQMRKLYEETYADASTQKGSAELISINNFLKIKPGDIILANNGLSSIVGVGRVTSNYIHDKSHTYHNILKMDWFDKQEKIIPGGRPGWLRTVMPISREEALRLISSMDPMIENLAQKLIQNKQIVLYGPPGTSKTHTAKKLAVSLFNPEVNDENLAKLFDDLSYAGKIELVQFHPSYSYEDFVQGIKPNVKDSKVTYEVKDGIFKKLCQSIDGGEGIDYEAKVEKFESIKNPIYAEEIGIRFHGPGINKTKKEKFFEVLEKIKTNHQVIDNFKEFEKITNFFFLITSEEMRERDNPKEFYRFGKGIPGYLQLKNALEEGKVGCIFYEKKIGGFYQLGILNGLDETAFSSTPKVLIIDEINRGNLSKIFGELIYALEYRNEEIRLQYSEFDDSSNGFLIVPDNLLIIGTMNTADRSIALFDIALRRRFAFIPMIVDYDIVLKTIGLNDVDVNDLKKKLDEKLSSHTKKVVLSVLALNIINKRIIDDIRMGREKQIGHTYLLKIANDENQFLNVWKYQIIPLLEEFYSAKYDELAKILGYDVVDKQKGIKDITENELESLLDNIISA